MFERIDMDNYFTVQAPAEGGTTELNLITGYDSSVVIKNFMITEDKKNGKIEYFSLYDTGLAVYFKQVAGLIEIFSNKEFEMRDDGNFHLVTD